MPCRHQNKIKKKEALNIPRNQKDLLTVASVYKAVYPNTPCCLIKLYTETSAVKSYNTQDPQWQIHL